MRIGREYDKLIIQEFGDPAKRKRALIRANTADPVGRFPSPPSTFARPQGQASKLALVVRSSLSLPRSCIHEHRFALSLMANLGSQRARLPSRNDKETREEDEFSTNFFSTSISKKKKKVRSGLVTIARHIDIDLLSGASVLAERAGTTDSNRKQSLIAALWTKLRTEGPQKEGSKRRQEVAKKVSLQKKKNIKPRPPPQSS